MVAPRSRDRGFSLVEMMITLVLVALVTVGLFRLFNSTNQTYRRGTQNIDGQQNARAALNWLAKELRSAKGFSQIGPSTVTFLSDKSTRNQIRTFRLDEDDIDGDGDTNELLLIRNPNDDGTLGVFTDEIAVGVDSLAFIFRDGNGNVTASRASVQEVEIFIFATGNQMRDEDAGEHSGTRQVGMSTRVKCRNLGKSVPTLGDETPPAAPTGISVALGCGTGTVSWSANTETDIAGYFLAYSQGSSGPPYNGTDADQGPSPIFVGNVTNYTLTGMDLSSTYYFNLQAVDQADNISGWGNQVNGVPSDASPPATPSNLSGRVIGNDRIQLSWTPVGDWDVEWYRIRWYDEADPLAVSYDSTRQTSLVLSGLAANAVYHCSISASDACGNEGPSSAEITVTMVPCDQDVTFPDIPDDFAVSPGDEFVQLSWTKVLDPDVVGYQVFFVGGAGFGSTLLVGNVDSYGVYGLENGVEYQFQVAALDGCGHLGGYTGAEATTPVACSGNTVPPGALANFAATDPGVGDRIETAWTQSPDTDVLGYKVYWGTAPGSYGSSLDVGENVFATIAGLNSGTTYYFSVTAYDVCANESPFASEVAVTPTMGCVCTPTLAVTTPGNFQLLSGVVPWRAVATACSTSAMEYVEFRIDGSTRYVDYASPFEFGDFGGGWSTYSESSGPHTLVTVAVDTAGCNVSDTLNVFVDNSGAGVACVAIEDGDGAVVSGFDSETLVVPVTNLSAVDTYQLEHVVLTWSDSSATLLNVTIDGSVAWFASSFPGASSGDTLAMASTIPVYPSDQVDMQLSFWSQDGSNPPNLDLENASYSATFFGFPIAVCGPYPFSTDTSCDIDDTSVTIDSVNSSRPYDVYGLPTVGTTYYTDRTYTITYLPEEIQESILVRQPNDDKNAGDSHLLELDISTDATVWVAYDPRGTPPNWVRNNYTNTGLSLGVTDTGTSTLALWKKDVNAGIAELYGNKANGWGGGIGTNYVIFVVCR